MYKILVLFALIAVVYSVPAPPSDNVHIAEGPRLQVNSAGEASTKAINGEIDPKNEKEELEGAEFGWGWKKWGWGYPSYRNYYHYPTYHYPAYHYPSTYYYNSYPSYWW